MTIAVDLGRKAPKTKNKVEYDMLINKYQQAVKPMRIDSIVKSQIWISNKNRIHKKLPENFGIYNNSVDSNPLYLTHLCLASFLWDFGKLCRHRPGAAKSDI